MIQLNNKQFRQTGGYSQGLRIPSVSSAPGASILKDDTMRLKPLKIKDGRVIDIETVDGQCVNIHTTPDGGLFVTVRTNGNTGEIKPESRLCDKAYHNIHAIDDNKYTNVTLVTSYDKTEGGE